MLLSTLSTSCSGITLDHGSEGLSSAARLCTRDTCGRVWPRSGVIRNDHRRYLLGRNIPVLAALDTGTRVPVCQCAGDGGGDD